MANLALTIKTLRERLGLSQVELGKALGVSRASVSNWEAGVNLPRGKRLQKIADALGQTLPQLMAGDLKVSDKRGNVLISVQYDGDELPLVNVKGAEPALWARTKQRVLVLTEKSGRRFGIVATEETIRLLEDCLEALRGLG